MFIKIITKFELFYKIKLDFNNFQNSNVTSSKLEWSLNYQNDKKFDIIIFADWFIIL